MAETVRLTARVDVETAEYVKGLAEGMGMPVSQLLGWLIQIAARSAGGTVMQFGEQMAALRGLAEDDTDES